MRGVFLIALASLAMPVAVADHTYATIALAPHEGSFASGENVALDVRIEVTGFWCTDGEELVVTFYAQGDGARGTFSQSELFFTVDDAPHFSEPYVATGTILLHVEADGAQGGRLDAYATLDPALDDCFSREGHAPVTASSTFAVQGREDAAPPPDPTPAPPPAPNPPPGEAPPEDFNETTGTDQDAPPAPPAPTPPPQDGAVDALPPGGGYIGDYVAPEESKATPGPAVAVLAAALCLAVALRRRAA